MAEKTETESLADVIAKSHRRPFVYASEAAADRRWLMIPTDEGGWVVKAEFRENEHGLITEKPPRVSARVLAQTAESLIDYCLRFANAQSLLFADIEASKIVGLIDYHGAPEGGGDTGPITPDFCDHQVGLELPYSQEWKTWSKQSGQLMPQLQFARFLEENAVDVVAPTGADLLEVCRDLQATRKVDFTKAVRTQTDNENFEFTDQTETKSKGGVEVPTKFKLSIPVYFGERPTEVYAFLRWALEDGTLKLGYVLHRAENVRQAIFQQIVLDIAHKTGLTALFGKP